MSLVGRTLLHYHVLEKVGAGGMGEVHRALDTKLDRQVSIKVLPAGFIRETERVTRLKREALVVFQQIAAALDAAHQKSILIGISNPPMSKSRRKAR